MYTVWMGKKAKRFQRESDVAVYWAKWPQKIKAIYVVKKKSRKKKDRIVSCVEGLLSVVTVIIVYAAVQVTAEQDTSKTGR